MLPEPFVVCVFRSHFKITPGQIILDSRVISTFFLLIIFNESIVIESSNDNQKNISRIAISGSYTWVGLLQVNTCLRLEGLPSSFDLLFCSYKRASLSLSIITNHIIPIFLLNYMHIWLNFFQIWRRLSFTMTSSNEVGSVFAVN